MSLDTTGWQEEGSANKNDTAVTKQQFFHCTYIILSFPPCTVLFPFGAPGNLTTIDVESLVLEITTKMNEQFTIAILYRTNGIHPTMSSTEQFT